MWFHKSRSISKREKRCNISFLSFGYTGIDYNGDVDLYLSNEEIEIDKEKLFKNQGINTNNAFNYKLSGIETNIFTLPLIDSQDNTSIYIGIKDYGIYEDVLCITKDNNHRYYLLLPYFKVDKDNLEEGKYVNKHTQMSYHLGLFEIQVQDEILTSAMLIDSVLIKNELSFNEVFVNYDKFRFGDIDFNYSLTGLFNVRVSYTLKLPLTETIYYFDIANLENPKIGTIKISGDDFDGAYHCGEPYFNKGRWFLQFRIGYSDYFIKDNCNGKYEKIEILKKESFDLNKQILLYNRQNNPYFPHETNYVGRLKEGYNDIKLSYIVGDSDLKKLPFSESRKRYLRFQFTPFNNLNLVYHNYDDRNYLYEYCLLAKNKDIYIVTELNPKTITSKYILNHKYKNKYHCYLYYLDEYTSVPYVQVWKDNKTKQVYGIVLNMMGKRGVFDKEIIEEK